MRNAGRMSKVRINDLARELEVKSKAILDVLPKVGVTEKKTHSSSVEEDEAERIRKFLAGNGGGAREESRGGSRADEIKPKFDFSKISKPGDVLKAIKKPGAETPAIAKAAPPAASATPAKAGVATPPKPAPKPTVAPAPEKAPEAPVAAPVAK